MLDRPAGIPPLPCSGACPRYAASGTGEDHDTRPRQQAGARRRRSPARGDLIGRAAGCSSMPLHHASALFPLQGQLGVGRPSASRAWPAPRARRRSPPAESACCCCACPRRDGRQVLASPLPASPARACQYADRRPHQVVQYPQAAKLGDSTPPRLTSSAAGWNSGVLRRGRCSGRRGMPSTAS